MISVADILDHLVSNSAVPSNFGAQLTRLRDGISGSQDPFRARDEVENNLMQQATLIRCLDQFAARPVLPIPRPAIIEKIQRETHKNQGHIAVAILRSYHERATKSQERGLVEVYRTLFSMAPDVVPAPPECSDIADFVQMFREGKARRCRSFAAEAYADALLGLQQHCRIHNRKNPNANH